MFRLVNGQIQINPEDLLVPEYKILWDRDITLEKAQAIREFKYMYLIHSYEQENPYRNYSDEERPVKAAEAAFGDKKYNPDNNMQAAIEKFCEIRDSDIILRLVAAARKALNNIISYLEAVDLTETDNDGKLVYDISKVLKTLEATPSLAQNLSTLEKNAQEQRYEARKTKANRTTNPFEI